MFEDFIAGPATGAGAAPLVRQHGSARGERYLVLKRLLDIAAVVLTAPVTLLVVGLLAMLVRRDGGPAFYAQKRLGKDGRVFLLWKLRSMVPDADAHLERYLNENPEARKEWDHAQKLKVDPRVTTIGRHLRKYSLDELPQLWNVLVGDMSLVGPRPMFPSQRELYPGTAYFDFRPGLTGLWQISERNASSFADRAGYDNRYAESVSLVTDLRVLFQTVAVVFRGTGC